MFEIKKIALSFCLVLTNLCGSISEIKKTDMETLKQAICASDTDLVKKTLVNSKLSKKDKNRFLRLAYERIDYRKSMVILARLGKRVDVDDINNQNECILFLGTICFSGISVLGFYNNSKAIGLTGLFGALLCVLFLDNNIHNAGELYTNAIEISDLINKA